LYSLEKNQTDNFSNQQGRFGGKMGIKKLRLHHLICFITTIVLVTSGFSSPGPKTDIETAEAKQVALPEFKLPYPSGKKIHWTGGPHAYSLGGLYSDTYSAGRGSGIDFGMGGTSFPVMAMARGEIIEASCGQYSTLGCIVAIENEVGGSVVIFAHLEDDSVFRNTKSLLSQLQARGQPFVVAQGTVVANAGRTGLGATGRIHLHVELRDGSNTCYANADCIKNGKGGSAFGNPLGWDDGLPLVDGYTIFGYIADGEGSKFNYDGSAVKGPTKQIDGFPFSDNGQRKLASVIVDETYACDPSLPTCEINVEGNPTQFASISGGGIFDSSLYVPSDTPQFIQYGHAGLAATSSPAYLISTNVPIWLPTTRSNDNASFNPSTIDVTIPDDTLLKPGAAFTKTWRLVNSGNTNWGSGYQLVFLRGAQMGASSIIEVPSTVPGSTVDLSVNMTAPSQNGTYTGYWRLRNPQGVFFGPEIYVRIRVEGNSASGPDVPTANGIQVIRADYPKVVVPGQSFRPSITIQLLNGELHGVNSRGDMLRHKSGGNYGAFPHVAVDRTVRSGEEYTFTFYQDMIAPTSLGTYESIWQIWAGGGWVGPEIPIQFQVQSNPNRAPYPPLLQSPDNWYVSRTGNIPTCEPTVHRGVE
jgi:hypothetical protein